MANTAIVGINWGDEGKGRMVDWFADQFDVVVRYQGGNNAGHTVINEYGKFALNLMPSGIFHKETINLLGAGVVIDLKRPSMQPVHAPVENLVYSGAKDVVRMTMIAGKVRYEDGAFFVGADAETIRREAAARTRALIER